MIFSILIILNHYRMSSSITRFSHTTTWDYFTESLEDCFIRSPKVVKEEIITDVSELVQEFRMTSNDGAVGESFKFFAMRRLVEVLEQCFDSLEVRFGIICFLRLLLALLIKIYRCRQAPFPGDIATNRLTTESA